MWFQDFVSSSAVYINEITHEPVYNKRERICRGFLRVSFEVSIVFYCSLFRTLESTSLRN